MKINKRILSSFLVLVIAAGSAVVGKEMGERNAANQLNAVQSELDALKLSIPAQKVPIGFSFDLPSAEPITITIAETSLIRIYKLNGSDGQSDRMLEDDLIEGMGILGVTLPESK